MIYNKYKPTNLNDIHHNKSIVNALLQIKKNENNYIIYGLDGTGKTTILMAYINSLFNYDNLIYEKKNTNIDLPINNNITSVVWKILVSLFLCRWGLIEYFFLCLM